MGYSTTKRCCEENLQLLQGLTDVQSRVLWNLSQALANLASAIETDVSGLESKVGHVEHDVKALRRSQ